MFIESTYCSYYVAIQSRFRVSNWVSGIRGFQLWDGLSPESMFGVDSSFKFSVLGAQTLHSILTRPIAILIPEGLE